MRRILAIAIVIGAMIRAYAQLIAEPSGQGSAPSANPTESSSVSVAPTPGLSESSTATSTSPQSLNGLSQPSNNETRSGPARPARPEGSAIAINTEA
jgi:hypothetical protein